MLKSINILDVKITSEPEEKVLEYVLQRLKNGSKKFFVTTPNPEILTYASSHLDYKDKLNEAEVSLPDGIGLLFAAKLMRKPLKSRITGTDFIEKLCLASKDQPVSMGFLGGKGGVAEKAVERLRKKYPWLKIGFIGEEWKETGGSVIFGPTDILFVAFGAPKQEEWIYKNLNKLPVKAAMGVGGAFDYISGNVQRAPFFVRKIGLEWLFRLIREPWRLKRQLSLIKFIWLILKRKNKKY